jgi:hypothetical protein
MKRADPNTRSRKQPGDPFGHFAGCFVGKGDRQNPARRHALFDDAGNPPGDHARLSGPRAGQDEKRAFRLFDGPLLAGGKVGWLLHAAVEL